MLPLWQRRGMKHYIREWRRYRGLSQPQLAGAVGTDKTQISKLENRERRLTTDWLQRLATALRCEPADLLRPPPTNEKSTSGRPPTATIPEIDVRAGMGGGGEAPVRYVLDGNGGFATADDVRAFWQFPTDYLRNELHARPADIRVFELIGDSQEPTLRSGDRALANVTDRTPSPPGFFALWDGFGIVVKRLELVPNSEPPTFRIISDNPKHGTYERTLDEINIVGRLVGYIRRL
jgi:transcriptional regulator with XRE-family HTH domain